MPPMNSTNDNPTASSGPDDGFFERVWPWSPARCRRRALRRLQSWAASNRDFVRRWGLSTFSFRNDGEIVVQARNGLWMRYLPEIKRSALGVERVGQWEPMETQLILNRLCPQAVFLDIGANCGWFSLCVGKQFPTAAVHAFEPVPQTFQTLQFNIQLNGVRNVQANNMGLWDSASELHFTNDLGPMNHIIPQADASSVSVRCIELDKYVQQTALTRVDFIKCDVEGAELHVLRGANRTLEQFGPAVLLENEDRLTKAFGYTPADVVQFLLDRGYRYSVITEEGSMRAGESIPSDLALGRDFLFERPRHA